MEDCNFFTSKTKGVSQFWQGLHKVKHLFKWGVSFKIGNGNNCRFWQDCWLHNVPLKISYENLYKMARDQEASVASYWEEDDWVPDFKRALSVDEFKSWEDLHLELQNCSLSNSCDLAIWALNSNKLFTTVFVQIYV